MWMSNDAIFGPLQRNANRNATGFLSYNKLECHFNLIRSMILAIINGVCTFLAWLTGCKKPTPVYI